MQTCGTFMLQLRLCYNVKQNPGALYIFKSKLNMENCTVTVHIEEWMHKGFSAALSNGS